MPNRYTADKLAEIEGLQAGLLSNDPANISAGEVKGLVARIESLEDSLRRLQDWAQAYQNFPEPDFKRANKAQVASNASGEQAGNFKLSIEAASGYEATTEGQCTASQYSLAMRALHGNAEDIYVRDAAKLNCPHCGGSGHVDDCE